MRLTMLTGSSRRAAERTLILEYGMKSAPINEEIHLKGRSRIGQLAKESIPKI